MTKNLDKKISTTKKITKNFSAIFLSREKNHQKIFSKKITEQKNKLKFPKQKIDSRQKFFQKSEAKFSIKISRH